MKWYIILSSFFVEAFGVHRHVIESPKITNWGTWGNFESCPLGTFVTGMQLKVERMEGWKDDTGLNGIRLFCSRLGSSVKIYEEEPPIAITSSVGPYGEWKDIFRCAEHDNLKPQTSAAVGFQLRVEPPSGAKDDTSANNFRIFCQDLDPTLNHPEEGPERFHIEGDGTAWGTWTDAQMCMPGYAICGVITQVDHGHNKGNSYDDTALNNVKAECCKIRFHETFSEESQEKVDHEIMISTAIESAKDLEETLRGIKEKSPEEVHKNPRKSITVPEVLQVSEITTTMAHHPEDAGSEEDFSKETKPESPIETPFYDDEKEMEDKKMEEEESSDSLGASPLVPPPEVIHDIESRNKEELKKENATDHILHNNASTFDSTEDEKDPQHSKLEFQESGDQPNERQLLYVVSSGSQKSNAFCSVYVWLHLILFIAFACFLNFESN